VSIKDIRRDCFAHALDAEQTRTLLDRLTAAGWLKLEVTKTGGRSLERWLVNPRLAESATSAGRYESRVS
jgi:hypothetical protein